jgi:MoCo/4Fe-4S cofactor protein with predicted Tat translocation signal
MPSMNDDISADLASRLEGKRGRELWRSLDELAAEPEFAAMLQREFPGLPALNEVKVGRRRFLELMGASFALGGLTACGPAGGAEEAVPYVEMPDGIVPGVARTYATAVTRGGYADGVLLTHQMGRPQKVDGNPDHPASLGATDSIIQASILDLYDPDRSQAVMNRGRISGADAFVAALAARGGSGLRILTGTVTSPTLAAQIDGLRRRFPELRWHRWEAETPGNAGAFSII